MKIEARSWKRSGLTGRQLMEALEPRELLSALVAGGKLPAFKIQPVRRRARNKAGAEIQSHTFVMASNSGVTPATTSPAGNAFVPSQIRHAYGMDQVMFGNIAGDGTGQTIAIIDAYHYATAWNDLQAFDAQFGLPDPIFIQVAQDGSQHFPTTDPAGPGDSWAIEEALDIQWAHVMAPAATIMLVEGSSPTNANLLTAAVGWARNQPGVAVISMSFMSNEFSNFSDRETNYDALFTTPNGHTGITFIASTGDTGHPGGYPAYSPNVVAVGGTSLALTDTGDYGGETGWSGSGGGISLYESKPSYQATVTQSATKRTIPDVALDADFQNSTTLTTGVAVYDSWDSPGSPWLRVGGTSLSAPMFGGIMAVVDQGRVLSGQTPLDGKTGTLPKLYALPSNDFHDVTSGNNGFAAGPGYDLVTGRGSPVGPLLVADMVGNNGINGQVFEDRNGDGVFNSGDVPISGTQVYLDTNGNGVLDTGGTQTNASGNVNLAIPDGDQNGVTSAVAINGLAGLVSDVNVTVNITHGRDSQVAAYLIGPDNTQITLFNGVGNTGMNFTNTTLDDQAGTSITAGTAPFTGSFRPSPGALSAFNGKAASGTWQLMVTDTHTNRNVTGTLVSWSITVQTPSEPSVTTGANGVYAFSGLNAGTYTVGDVAPVSPLGYVPTTASNQSLNVTWQTAAGFGFFPTVFNSVGPNDQFYVWLDPDTAKLQIGKNAGPTNPIYQITPAAIPNLRFNLSSAGSRVIVDYGYWLNGGGNILPAGGMGVDGGGLADSTLVIRGQSSGQQFTMNDTQIGPTGQPAVMYQNLGVMSLYSSTVLYNGSLNTLGALNTNDGTFFYWMGS